MPYTAPSGNAVDFDQTAAPYTRPPANTVNFNCKFQFPLGNAADLTFGAGYAIPAGDKADLSLGLGGGKLLAQGFLSAVVPDPQVKGRNILVTQTIGDSGVIGYTGAGFPIVPSGLAAPEVSQGAKATAAIRSAGIAAPSMGTITLRAIKTVTPTGLGTPLFWHPWVRNIFYGNALNFSFTADTGGNKPNFHFGGPIVAAGIGVGEATLWSLAKLTKMRQIATANGVGPTLTGKPRVFDPQTTSGGRITLSFDSVYDKPLATVADFNFVFGQAVDGWKATVFGTGRYIATQSASSLQPSTTFGETTHDRRQAAEPLPLTTALGTGYATYDQFSDAAGWAETGFSQPTHGRAQPTQGGKTTALGAPGYATAQQAAGVKVTRFGTDTRLQALTYATGRLHTQPGAHHGDMGQPAQTIGVNTQFGAPGHRRAQAAEALYSTALPKPDFYTTFTGVQSGAQHLVWGPRSIAKVFPDWKEEQAYVFTSPTVTYANLTIDSTVASADSDSVYVTTMNDQTSVFLADDAEFIGEVEDHAFVFTTTAKAFLQLSL